MLIENIHPTCIRGNYSEIRALMEHCITATGVDSGDKNLDIEAMKQYAKQYHLIMIASGEKDIITDGMTVYICENGDAKMAKITGSGCMSSVMLGAFLGTVPSVAECSACCAFVGIAGELAAGKNRCMRRWNHDVRNFFIDEVSLMTQEKMSRCKVHI